MRSTIRRSFALVASAALLASLTAATVAAPASAAKQKVMCRGEVATIVGTNKADRLVGTNKRDVIAGLGGNDVIIGAGGNDLICGGTGKDRLAGKGGRDRLYGNGGPDTLVGGRGADRLFGGVGNDLLIGQLNNDLLGGGPGTDTCYQGTGSGREVSCELPAAPVVEAPKPEPPKGPELIDLDANDILAIAYSDIDDLDGYSTGDVMIAQLVDTDGNGPDVGDLIEMGRYPTNVDATSFEDWGVKSHVAVGRAVRVDSITVSSAAGSHLWLSNACAEEYHETGAGTSRVRDVTGPVNPPFCVSNLVQAVAASPSKPTTEGTWVFSDEEDSVFVDVELNYEVP
jgi:hypothetical protein